MLDVAWPELFVVGAVALVAVGPKDLPKVMHTLGRLAGKARDAMHELRVCVDQAVYEAEMAEKQESGEKPPEPPHGKA